jgi:hypothetical protein
MTDKLDKKPGLGEGDEMMGPRPAIVMPSHGIYRSSKSILSRVKDSAGPCDCIKDLNDSQSVKKTQIVSMLMLTLLSLVNMLLSSKF